MISQHIARARAHRWFRAFLALPIFMTLPVSPSVAQMTTTATDPTRAGRFDMGKMWTFENAPMEYFSETYGFQADGDWFEGARLAALRVPGCSAAFVSPNGLVVTNHHCARGSVGQVTRDGESLLDTGFYATSLEEERPIPDYYVDQLIAAEDVSAEVLEALDQATSADAKTLARAEVVARIQERVVARHAGDEGEVRVEVTALYNGGRYSAYTYRRFTDVRMVAAAELQLGNFGGDPDNFTYPRYMLDFAFLRVYGSDGEPLETDNYFNWSLEGVEEGDPVFVIGSPGPTNRLNTVAQLEFQRDVSVATQKSFLSSRLTIMREFYEDHREQGEAMGLRDQMFSLSNSLKANSGRLEALKDPVIMARKADGERLFQEALTADPELSGRWGSLLDDIAEIQREKMALGAEYAAFTGLAPGGTEASVLSRALYGIGYLDATVAGGPPSQVEQVRRLILGVEDLPFEMEEAFLAARLQDIEGFLGADHPVTVATLEGRSVEGATTVLMNLSALATREKAQGALNNGSLSADDPAIRLAQAIFPTYLEFQSRLTALTEREQELAANLGRVRFAVYGPDVPPDASRSPRITDGVVKPYEYNGTLAPVYTTFFGLFDHYYSYGRESDWNLPDRWLPPPPT